MREERKHHASPVIGPASCLPKHLRDVIPAMRLQLRLSASKTPPGDAVERGERQAASRCRSGSPALAGLSFWRFRCGFVRRSFDEPGSSDACKPRRIGPSPLRRSAAGITTTRAAPSRSTASGRVIASSWWKPNRFDTSLDDARSGVSIATSSFPAWSSGGRVRVRGPARGAVPADDGVDAERGFALRSALW